MSHDDFEREPIPGLPAHLPEGEEIKWQGAPDQGAIAKKLLHRNKIAAYFAIVATWKFATALYDGGTVLAAISNSAFMVGLGIVVMALLWLFARAIANTTIYTITNRRIVMRFGIALPVTFNYPFKQVVSADVQDMGNNTGTIALCVKEHTKLSWAILWPHARPFRFAKPEPAMRLIKDLDEVSQILSRQLNDYHKQRYVPADLSKEEKGRAGVLENGLEGQRA